ncbi:MAG TPA: glycoside hydrolase family 27 protein [Ktedonobacteraceae bacterium]|nr:glycoside hydrolase family 27 protein [Ktedonobacteraceae bacterium]
MVRRILILLIAFLCAIVLLAPGFLVQGSMPSALAEDNGLALTPPMGFNDWNAFHCGVTEAEIKQAADFISSSGLKSAGYRYVNVDDCWMASSRDSHGNLVPDPTKFPDGIKALADYVHHDDLLFGIYEGAGTQTCAHKPGSYKHETQDATTFASWGVDYLKYDWCNGHSVPFTDFPGQTHDQVAQTLYTKMSKALNASGRPIVFSMCNGADSSVHPANWGAPISNLWRTTHDIHPNWASILSIYTQNVTLFAKAGPGHWNDPDMLEVGNGSLTTTEEQTHFSLWAEMAAPLLIGTNLLTASKTTLSILLNTNVIAIDQDSLGVQGHIVSKSSSGSQQVLTKPLANGDVAVVLLNEGTSTATITTNASAVGLPQVSSYTLSNLWAGTHSTTSGTITASVASHGVVMLHVHAG